jgi:TM2 domain-containing membrane protein YozV
MSDSPAYTLRWRGREAGPYPVSEINRLLDDHKIGMGHEIRYQDEWITLEQFFSTMQKAAASAQPRAKTATPAIPVAPAAAAPAREKPSPIGLRVSVTPTVQAARAPAEAGSGEGPPRHRLVFALLAVFTGFFGLHNFYARQWLTGLLQLLLTVATCLMGFGIFASWLWAVVEAVVVRRDGQGVEMI